MYGTIDRCNYLLERKTNKNFEVKLEAAAKDLVETHYYIRKYNLKSLDENPFYKILGHIYCAYWSCIIQQCNFYELMRRVGHDEYDNFIVTPDDIRRTVLWYTDKFKNCIQLHIFQYNSIQLHTIIILFCIFKFLESYNLHKSELLWKSQSIINLKNSL